MKKTVYESPWLKLSVDAQAKSGLLVVNGVLGQMPATAEAAGKTLVIDGIIGSYDWSADTWKEAQARRQEQFRKDLQALADAKVDELVIEISSLGGNFAHALAMHDFLAQYPGKVITRVVGMTASSATILAQAGNVRQISANVLYLVHRSTNYAYGNANSMRAMLDDLEAIDARMAAIYAKRAGKPEADMLAVMDEHGAEGKWMPAARVVELGLADEVFEPMQAAACAVPPPSSFLALGLPPPPASEQTGQRVEQGGSVSAAKSNPTEETTAMLTPEQVKKLHARFGAETAVAAVAEELSYEAAVEKGIEALAAAKAAAEASLAEANGKLAQAEASLTAANAKLAAAAKGAADPLASHTNPPPDDPAAAKATAEAAADAAKRAEIDRIAQGN